MVKRYLNGQHLDDVFALLDREFPRVLSTDIIPFDATPGGLPPGPFSVNTRSLRSILPRWMGSRWRARETVGASEQHPVELENAIRVNTGNIVPPGYDAVIMIEDTWQNGDRYVIRKSTTPWQHIRPAGEDLAESEMVLPSGHRIRPHEVGALATYGITEMEVLSVRVGLVPTGSELVPAGPARPRAR